MSNDEKIEEIRKDITSIKLTLARMEGKYVTKDGAIRIALRVVAGIAVMVIGKALLG